MYFEDIKLGMSVETEPRQIKKENMIAFAHEYDPLRIHTDEEYAKGSVFGTLIAPGVMSFMSVWAKFLELDFFGDELVAGKSTKIEWFKPVHANDVLKGKAAITGLTEYSSRNGLVEITMEVFNQLGELVLTDVTEVFIKCRPLV